MARQADNGDDGATQEVVRRAPRLLAGVAIFAAGVAAGALASELDTSDHSEPAAGEAIGIGCGVVTLVVDAEDLPGSTYELRASVGPRMLPMIKSMTHALIGAQEGHQLLVPEDGRLLVVANVPAGTGDARRWELVGAGADPAVGGMLTDTCPPATC